MQCCQWEDGGAAMYGIALVKQWYHHAEAWLRNRENQKDGRQAQFRHENRSEETNEKRILSIFAPAFACVSVCLNRGVLAGGL